MTHSVRYTVTKDILHALANLGRELTFASYRPIDLVAVIPAVRPLSTDKDQRKIYNSFSYLKKRGFIDVESRRGEISVRLTEKGRKHAQELTSFARFKELAVRTPRSWDGKWHLVLFDVRTGEETKRNALRDALRRIGCAYLQKSVWIHPFDCRKEIDFLRNFFHLSQGEVMVITASAFEGDTRFRRIFKLV